jgi:hypothetical protein
MKASFPIKEIIVIKATVKATVAIIIVFRVRLCGFLREIEWMATLVKAIAQKTIITNEIKTIATIISCDILVNQF